MALFHRIVQERWSATAMDGEGARRYGGRWNSPGLPAVYLAESRALAALEILVHAPREALLLSWIVIGMEIPDDWLETASPADLPPNWRAQPSSSAAQAYGSEWLRSGRGVALVLPSVVIPEEHSLLVNPLHPRMSELKPEKPKPFSFDPRLSV
ncbi:MAG: RES family NAD+ phosphorylase [Luteolibacter sp.]